jgi:hypothetical protein
MDEYDLDLDRDEILEIAFENSYKILMGECEIEDIMRHKLKDRELALFIYDPEDEPEFDDIILMLLYFEKVEMYERCAILKKMAAEMKKE